jgi:hypothetical protein
LRLIDGRIRTLPGVLHIPGLARNLIYVRKMDDAGVKTIFEKETCRMVRGAMVLLKGVRFGTLYKLQGSTISDGCNSSIVPDIGVEEERTPTVSGEKVMLWHQRLGHIGEKGLDYYTVKVWLKVCLTSLWILISVNIVYMGSRIG